MLLRLPSSHKAKAALKNKDSFIRFIFFLIYEEKNINLQ
jgi:hypothetical protein